MADTSEFLQNEIILNYALGAELRLYSVAATKYSSGTEITGYTPQDATMAQDPADLGKASNSAPIEFDLADDCIIAGVALTTPTGDILWPRTLTPPRSYAAGAHLVIDVGEVLVDLD